MSEQRWRMVKDKMRGPDNSTACWLSLQAFFLNVMKPLCNSRLLIKYNIIKLHWHRTILSLIPKVHDKHLYINQKKKFHMKINSGIKIGSSVCECVFVRMCMYLCIFKIKINILINKFWWHKRKCILISSFFLFKTMHF